MKRKPRKETLTRTKTINTMSKKSENAKRLYLEGIKEGKIEVVDEFTGDRYTQHSTGVADGPEGFKEFFKGFLERTNKRDIQLIRVIADGRHVFVHAYQDIDDGSAKWVTTDLFDTDKDDKIIEHWDVIAPYVDPSDTPAGNDIILGDFEISDMGKTESNKALVRMFLTDVVQNRNHSALEKYVSKESFIQHSSEIAEGFDAFSEHLQAENHEYDFVFRLIGEGNHVVSMSQVTSNNQPFCVFDIFRVENDKIVEHWDNKEPIPPRSEWANTGKF